MKRLICLFALLALLLLLPAAALSAPVSGGAAEGAKKEKKSVKEGLQVVHDLIGSWKGTGVPSGTRAERERGYWQETVDWQWQVKGSDMWLRGDVAKGKHYTKLELRYRPDEDSYQLKAWTVGKETLTFTGKLDSQRLLLERTDEAKKQSQRLVISLLHSNRYLYRYEVKPVDRVTYSPVYQVGVTKQGVPFAVEDKGIECIVSGGKGTMAVTYKGKTYYVCCGGCRDAFREDPEKYIKEYEESLKEAAAEKKKKEKKEE